MNFTDGFRNYDSWKLSNPEEYEDLFPEDEGPDPDDLRDALYDQEEEDWR
jgi:hypothetical protein